MVNLKRSAVTYQPFKGQAILADGLLAVERPGGELEEQIARSMFGLANTFGQVAERTAQRRGEELGQQAAADALPRVDVEGGDELPAQPEVGAGLSALPVPNAKAEPASQTSGSAMPGSVRDAIAQAAARHGVSPAVLTRIAQIESNGNPNARNPTSSAGGLFQQIDSNAAQYGVKDRFDPYQSADGAARFLRDNQAYLTRKLGRQPTAGELYLAHQQGPGGAARLLLNANAPAVRIVGPDAVRLNGGTANMTAGEFAAKWTAKAGGGSAAAMVSGEKRRSPLSIKLTGGGLKLTGRDTIFGRAYDQAAGATFRRALEDEMLDASSQLYDKYKDDPTELSLAFQDLKRAQLAEHVPDGIRNDYEQAFSRVERKYLRQAQGNREEAIDKADRQAYDAESGRLSENVSRANEGLDPGNSESVDIAAAEANRLKDHYREGVARDYLSPQAASEAAAEADGQAAVTFYGRQADGMTAAEVGDFQKTLQADYAAGKLPNVNAATWVKLKARLNGAAADISVAEAEASRVVEKQVADDIASTLATGTGLNPAATGLTSDMVTRVLGADAARDWRERRAEAQLTHAALAGIDQMPGAAIEERLADLEPQAGEADFALKQKVFERAVDKTATLQKLRDEDPALAADQAFKALRGEELRKDPARLAAARLAAQATLGIGQEARQPLTNAEARRLAERISLYRDDEEAQQVAIERLVQESDETYGGDLGQMVMTQVLHSTGVSRETAGFAVEMMRKIGAGRRPSRDDVMRLEAARARDQAENAMGGASQPPRRTQQPNTNSARRGAPKTKPARKRTVPNFAQVELLRKDPGLATYFDDFFGEGAAEEFLKVQVQDEVYRMLPDGSIEQVYKDGWIETTHPDGSFSGRQGP